jgi:putative flippase GtrA
MAGGAGALVHLSVLVVFTEALKFWSLVSTSAGFLTACLVSFFLQKFWTFNDRRREHLSRQMLFFFLVALGNFVLNAALMYALVEGIRFPYLVAQFFVIGSIAIESFYIYRFHIFRESNS